MDRHLKERLVGAVVLMAAAIILIPEMLSGPRKSDAPASASDERTVDNETSKLKTYTIDVSKPTAAPLAGSADSPTISASERTPTRQEEIVTTPAPPAEIPGATSQAPSSKSSSVESPTLSAQESRTTIIEKPAAERPGAEKPVAPRVVVEKPNVDKPVEKPHPAEAPSVAGSTTTGGWAVQVGSFSQRATSDRIANELRNAGFPAYVVAFQAGGKSMYRVRVGPARDRAAAEALLRKVKAEHRDATLVPP